MERYPELKGKVYSYKALCAA